MANRSTPPPSPDLYEAARGLDATAEPPADELEAMLHAVHRDIEVEDRSVLGYFRSRPTWLRRLLMTAALAVPVLVPTAAAGLRDDWQTLRTGATTALALLIAAFAIGCGWLATRPLQRRGLTAGADWVLFATALGVMVGAALLNHGVDAAESTTWRGDAACMGIGLGMALPAMVAGRLLHRGSLSAPLLTATGAALTANLGLLLRCPINDASHCLLGHVSVALWLALAVLWVRRYL